MAQSTIYTYDSFNNEKKGVFAQPSTSMKPMCWTINILETAAIFRTKITHRNGHTSWILEIRNPQTNICGVFSQKMGQLIFHNYFTHFPPYTDDIWMPSVMVWWILRDQIWSQNIGYTATNRFMAISVIFCRHLESIRPSQMVPLYICCTVDITWNNRDKMGRSVKIWDVPEMTIFC